MIEVETTNGLRVINLAEIITFAPSTAKKGTTIYLKEYHDLYVEHSYDEIKNKIKEFGWTIIKCT